MAIPVQLTGKRVLVVEDEPLIAMEIAAILEEVDVEVIGPAGSVAQAHQLIARAGGDLQAALLDINVAGEPIASVVAALEAKGVPFAFMTGDSSQVSLPAPNVPMIRKPFLPDQVLATVKILVGA